MHEHLAQGPLRASYVEQPDRADHIVTGQRDPEVPVTDLVKGRNQPEVRLLLRRNLQVELIPLDPEDESDDLALELGTKRHDVRTDRICRGHVNHHLPCPFRVRSEVVPRTTSATGSSPRRR